MLTLKDIEFSLGAHQILRGISFTVPRGETLGIIGPNGSGKTTLFNCLSGFNDLDSGSIFLADTDITKTPPYERANLGIGRVFQNFGIFREMTVLENMLVALESKAGLIKTFLQGAEKSRQVVSQSLDALEQVGLKEKANALASSLSGGQMRLLEIARTLAAGAELILLDEPTAGVSPIMKEEVGAFIQKLKSLGRTVLIIEHDINFIQKFCDRIIVLDGGKVIMDGPPAEVRASKQLEQIYFGIQTT
jgi:ABC-type branched-subunit amino acid transport system ATPase component